MEGVYDCVVVGAGLAGLQTASWLSDAGYSVVVLEARDRPGGRTYSPKIGDENWDMGAGWIGEKQPRIMKLCKKFGIQTYPQYDEGKHILIINGKKTVYSGNISSLNNLGELDTVVKLFDELMLQVPLDRPQDSPKALEWDSINVEMWQRENMKSETAINLLNFIIRTVFAAEPHQISFLYFLHYLRTAGGYNALADIRGGAQQDRVVGGTQGVSIALARELGIKVVFNAPVRKITQWAGGVSVHSDLGVFRAKYSVIAIPPLLAGAIEYDPPVPHTRDHLTQRMPMGCVIKCYILYQKAFWREEGYSGEVLSTDSPICLYYDATSSKGQPALIGFIAGSAATQWSGKIDTPEIKKAIIDQLVSMYGPAAANPTQIVMKDWTSEQWSRGCYVAVMNTGVLSAYGEALRKPVGRLHWAGCETALEWAGYMEGALESGERAATEVKELLAKEKTDAKLARL